MVFMFNIALALVLLALGLGIGMLIWAFRTGGIGTTVAKVFGFIIVIIAALALLCTVMHGMKAMSKSYDHGMYQGKPMTQCPYIKKGVPSE